MHSLRRLIAEGGDEFDAHIQHQAHVLTFEDRSDLGPDMAGILKACGRRYRGAKAWPELLMHEPGLFPRPPHDPADLARIQTAIECLFGMFVETGKSPGWERFDHLGRPWVAFPEPDGMTTLRRHPLPSPPPPRPVVPITVNEVTAARLRTVQRALPGPMLVDWIPSHAVIDGPEANGRPYYAMLLLAIDPHTGMILHFSPGRLISVWQELADATATACTTHGLPTELHVRRPDAVTQLKPLATALGIPIVHCPESVDLLRELHEQIEMMMG